MKLNDCEMDGEFSSFTNCHEIKAIDVYSNMHLEKKVWQGKLNKFCNFNYAFISLRGFFKVFGIEKMKKRPSPPKDF